MQDERCVHSIVCEALCPCRLLAEAGVARWYLLQLHVAHNTPAHASTRGRGYVVMLL